MRLQRRTVPPQTGVQGVAEHGHRGRPPESLELRQLRARIDALDKQIVALLNERADLALEVGRTKADLGRRAVRDAAREREILVRIAMANDGPMPQADLLALYRRLFAATRNLESADRARREPGDA